MTLKQCFGDCACNIVSDPSGTTTVTGSGSVEDPFVIVSPNMPYTRPVGRATRTTTQSIPFNVLTVVTMNSETFDTDNMIDIAGNPTRLTITTPGIYLISAGVQWAASSGAALGITWHEISLRRNGVSVEAVEGFGDITITSPQPILMSIIEMFNCVAGDYWELLVQHGSNVAGSALNLDPTATTTFGSSASPIRLEAIRLGAAL